MAKKKSAASKSTSRKKAISANSSPASKRKSKNYGLIKHETTTFQLDKLSPEDLREAIEEAINETSIWTFIENAELWARETLLSVELPDHLGPFIKHKDGSWDEYFSVNDPRQPNDPTLNAGDSICTLEFIADQKLLRYSPGWTAVRILRHSDSLRQFVNANNVESAVWAAFRLMKFIHIAEFKNFHEAPLIRAKNFHKKGPKKGAQKSAQKRHEASVDTHEEWQRRAMEIWAVNPKLSKISMARLIANEEEEQEEENTHKPNTIRKHIRKY